MPTYKSSVSIERPPGAVFEFLGDVHNIPRYMPQVTAVDPQADDRVRVTYDHGGQSTTTEGTFRVHDGHRKRIEWALDPAGGYRGWLEVDAEGEVCSVTAEIHAAAEMGVDAALDQALFALKQAAERL